MAGQGTCGSHAAGVQTAHPVPGAAGSPAIAGRIAGALADMATFSLSTGLRAANVAGLMWSQVDLDRRLAWIHPDQAKARKAIPVPLNAEAVAVVTKQLGKHATHVFSYRGSRITQVSTKAWYSALERAGIGDFRWHDLRHTWASWHVQGGTPLYVLQEMGGWASAEMVRRCAPCRGSSGALCRAMDTLRERGSAIHGTNPSQSREGKGKKHLGSRPKCLIHNEMLVGPE